ncbi:hypothetical protein ABPG77_007884 [Micractinium sp. CCAP 211/92]
MLSTQCLSARCWAGQVARGRHVPSSQAPERRAQLLVAAADKQAGGGGSTVTDPTREMVTFVQPDGTTLCIEQPTQDDLDWVLEACGARGFVTADGTYSGALGRLPEGGTVRLSYAWEDEVVSRPPTKQEMAPLREFVRSVAAAEHGEPVLQLQSTPFTYAGGDEYMRMEIAFVAGDTVYVGHYQRELDEMGVYDLCFTRSGLLGRHEGSPELALALDGVASMKLFLGGPAVSEELTVERLVEAAEEEGFGVVLPIDEGLGLAGAAPLALPM